MPGVPILSFAPPFTAQALMPDDSFKDISLSDYHGKHLLLFFYPYDFTKRCRNELLEMHEFAPSFSRLETEVIGVSADSIYAHLKWSSYSRRRGGIGRLSFPLLSDKNGMIAKSYNIYIEEKGISYWALFIIDDKGILRHATVCDNIPNISIASEAFRVLQYVILFGAFGEITIPQIYKKHDKYKMEILKGPWTAADSEEESEFSDHFCGHAESMSSDSLILGNPFTSTVEKQEIEGEEREEEEEEEIRELGDGFSQDAEEATNDLNEDFDHERVKEKPIFNPLVGENPEICHEHQPQPSGEDLEFSANSERSTLNETEVSFLSEDSIDCEGILGLFEDWKYKDECDVAPYGNNNEGYASDEFSFFHESIRKEKNMDCASVVIKKKDWQEHKKSVQKNKRSLLKKSKSVRKKKNGMEKNEKRLQMNMKCRKVLKGHRSRPQLYMKLGLYVKLTVDKKKQPGEADEGGS